jgi:GT2 family glycosyltransferase
LEEYLPSVLASTYPNAVLYVADNGSQDSSVAWLREQGFVDLRPVEQAQGLSKERQLLCLDQNYGFAEGYNRALAQIKDAEYFILLNSDVAVSAGWIEPLVALLEAKPKAAAVQPKILWQRKKEYFEHAGAAGGYLDGLGYPFCRGRIFEHLEQDQGQYNDEQEIFWASGAAFCVRAPLFAAFGGFDAAYFAHMEEIDLCWRWKRAGYEIWYQGSSSVWHLGGGTLAVEHPRKTYLNFRNSLCTLYKNEGGLSCFFKVFARLLLDGLAGLRFLSQGKWGNLWAIIRAHWAFFAWLPQLYGQKKRLLADLERLRIGSANKVGHWSGSLVWAHFFRGKKTIGDLGLK